MNLNLQPWRLPSSATSQGSSTDIADCRVCSTCVDIERQLPPLPSTGSHAVYTAAYETFASELAGVVQSGCLLPPMRAKLDAALAAFRIASVPNLPTASAASLSASASSPTSESASQPMPLLPLAVPHLVEAAAAVVPAPPTNRLQRWRTHDHIAYWLRVLHFDAQQLQRAAVELPDGLAALALHATLVETPLPVDAVQWPACWQPVARILGGTATATTVRAALAFQGALSRLVGCLEFEPPDASPQRFLRLVHALDVHKLGGCVQFGVRTSTDGQWYMLHCVGLVF
jgi:hypothetical protein